MKAIVLTCDKYRTLTEHMIYQYNKLWPGHPFTFHIPYQELKGEDENTERNYIKSPVEIKDTVLVLLKDIDDDEWIYWCPDDKFPIQLNLPKIRYIHQWISRNNIQDISGVLFCRCRNMYFKKYLTGYRFADDIGNVYLERNNYSQIWVHQFLRAKVLRYLFCQFNDYIPNAKAMDNMKSKVDLPKSHRIFVTEKNYAYFGESTSRGKLTINCFESLKNEGFSIPNSFDVDKKKRIIIGGIEKEPFVIKKIGKKIFKGTQSLFKAY